MDSETSDNSSDYSSSSTESSEDDGMETAEIQGHKLQLPQGLCERLDIFKEVLSSGTWNSLPENQRQYLQQLLPDFPGDDFEEKNRTLQSLFEFGDFRFKTTPLEAFHEQLKAGHFRPDIVRMRQIIRKTQSRESRYRYKMLKEKIINSVLESRKSMLNQVRNLPPGVQPGRVVEKGAPPGVDLSISYRTKKRYFQVLANVRAKTEDGGFSSDDNYVDGPPNHLSRKQKRHLNGLKNNGGLVTSTLSSKASGQDLDEYVTSSFNPFYVNDDGYKYLLMKHKRRKTEHDQSPECNVKGISVSDVIKRTQLHYVKNNNVVLTSINKHHQHNHNHQHQHHQSKSPQVKRKIKKESSFKHHRHRHHHHSSNTENDSDSDSLIDSVSSSTYQQHQQLPPPPAASKNKSKSRHHQHDGKVIGNVVRENKTQTVTKLPSPALTKTSIPTPDSTPTPTSTPQMNLMLPQAPIMAPKVNLDIPISIDSPLKPINSFTHYGKIAPVTLSDLEGIDMMNLPIDLDNSDIDILEMSKPELMQDTHANFFSLLRDIICSTTEHRMKLSELEEQLRQWQASPISPLNDWYNLVENWTGLLASAIDFLTGSSPDIPDDFVPYIEHKIDADTYQWIGAGRDSDLLLCSLYRCWFENRNKEGREAVAASVVGEPEPEVSDRSQTPPPPRCPTSWTVRKQTQNEIKEFQEQERQRYDNPHKSFTYRCNGYESIVGPLKGIYSSTVASGTKARGHSLLIDDRPNFVTILSLVRDSAARLPNGEGTRADICELLKCSQYISPSAADNVLQTVVSGALDRMHTQFDPCVKYDPKRKIWIYLHRNRTEEDFERIHQQCQGMSSRSTKKVTKKTITTPSKPKVVKVKNSDPERPVNKSLKTKPILQVSSSNKPTSTSLLLSSNASSLSSSSSETSQNSNLPQISELPSPLITSTNQSQEDREINAALQSIMQTAVSSSGTPSPVKLQPKTNQAKSVMKIISPQGKSLIIPSSSSQPVKKNQSRPSTPQINNQLLPAPTISSSLSSPLPSQKQTIQIIQKPSDEKEMKVPVSIPVPVSIQQLQNIKNVTLLRTIPHGGAGSGQSIPAMVSLSQGNEMMKGGADAEMVVADGTESIVSSNFHIKTTGQLTPIQQQQILQTIKQKILPQATIIAPQQQQQQIVIKQKSFGGGVQKQGQVLAPGASLLGSNKITAESSKGGMPATQSPVVAKVLTNAAGQVISVESLLAHQKQHTSLPPNAIRVSGAKSSASSLIQISGTTGTGAQQFTAVGPPQNNVMTLTSQPLKVVASQTTTVTTSVTTARPVSRTPASRTHHKFPSKVPVVPVQQQLINAKLLTPQGVAAAGQPKIIMSQPGGQQVKLTTGKNVALSSKPVTLNVGGNAAANMIRMVNAANLNLTHIGGKPVLLASKAGGSIQGLQPQNVVIQTQAGSSTGQQLLLQGAPVTKVMGGQHQVKAQQVSSQQVLLGKAAGAGGTQSLVLGGVGGHPIRVQGTGGAQRVVLTSQAQGGQFLTQQFLLPANFQGTPINIKALQGVKVIPIAQTHTRGLQGRQVFARVMNPAVLKAAQQQQQAGGSGVGAGTTNNSNEKVIVESTSDSVD